MHACNILQTHWGDVEANIKATVLALLYQDPIHCPSAIDLLNQIDQIRKKVAGEWLCSFAWALQVTSYLMPSTIECQHTHRLESKFYSLALS